MTNTFGGPTFILLKQGQVKNQNLQKNLKHPSVGRTELQTHALGYSRYSGRSHDTENVM